MKTRIVSLLMIAASINQIEAQQAVKTPNLADYRTVDTAATTKIAKAARVESDGQPAYLGVHLLVSKAGYLRVGQIDAESPAAKAGLQLADILVKADGQNLTSPDDLREILAAKSPGDAVKIDLTRKSEAIALEATLVAPSRVSDAAPPRPTGKNSWDARMATTWRKESYRLAVIGIDYPNATHNDAISVKDWNDALFSTNTYNKVSVTGQPVHGSMRDYYREISYGTFRVEGKFFPWVKVSKKREDYGPTTNKTALLVEAMDVLLARDGPNALKDFDGVFFLHAGGRVNTPRGTLYWPHQANFTHQGKRWRYFISPEGVKEMANISVFCHEFGHMLGLPDLYARPEVPGSEGAGVWCAMANQVGKGKPQHFSAWSKEQLGWLKPAVIDPSVKQKLILGPVQGSPKECYKVLARPDGSEYFLLENRTARGFDASLPAHGLLIWRVVRGRPILEESHGIAGPAGPRTSLALIPFPSSSNDAFTPYTVPSSRPLLGSGSPVHITNIRKLPDGRIAFQIGYEYY